MVETLTKFNFDFPIQTNREYRRRKWGKEETEKLLIGLQEYGIGSWEQIVKNLLPNYTTLEIKSRVQKLMGREDLSDYVAWRPDKNDIEIEYNRNKELAQHLNLWKNGVFIDSETKLKNLLKIGLNKQKQEKNHSKKRKASPMLFESSHSKSPTSKMSTTTSNINRASTQLSQNIFNTQAMITQPVVKHQFKKKVIKKPHISYSTKKLNSSNEILNFGVQINKVIMNDDESDEIYDGSDFDSDENSPDNLIGEDVLVWFTEAYYRGTAVGYDPNLNQFLIRWKLDGTQSYTSLRPSDRTTDESNQDRWCKVTEREEAKHLNKKARIL